MLIGNAVFVHLIISGIFVVCLCSIGEGLKQRSLEERVRVPALNS